MSLAETKKIQQNQTMQNLHCSIFLSLSQRQIAFLRPLEWRNLFESKSKVPYYEKLVIKSGVGLLILFVLMDDILLRLDLQKKYNVQIQFINFLHNCLTYSNQISKNWKHVFRLTYENIFLIPFWLIIIIFVIFNTHN